MECLVFLFKCLVLLFKGCHLEKLSFPESLPCNSWHKGVSGAHCETVRGMDADAEPTGTYLWRVSQCAPDAPLSQT